MNAFFETFFFIIGLISFLFYLYDVLKAPIILTFYFIKVCINFKDVDLKKKYGNWAAITGCTDGIGKEYACNLAERGFNVVLISRNREKLKSLAKDIEGEYFVETKIIVADFTKGKEACSHVEKQMGSIPVGILVNNVGQTTTDPGPLFAFDDDELWNVILTNIGAITQLSRFFIKDLIKAGKKGAVVNVSSATAYFPIPNNAIYAATKAFTHSLTRALQDEVRPYSGIDVQLLSPHFVSTKFIKYCEAFKMGNLFIPDAATFARAAVRRLGKVSSTTGYYRHDIEEAIIKACPWRLTFLLIAIFSNYITNRMRGRTVERIIRKN